MYQQKNSDVIRHDDFVEEGAIRDYLGAELKELVAYLPVVEAAVQKAAKGLNDSLKGVKLEGATLSDLKQINELTKQANDLEKTSANVRKVKQELTARELAQRQLDNQAKRDQITLIKAEIVEMDKAAKSIANLNAENAKLRVLVKSADLSTKEGIENVKKWNEQINKNTEFIKANSDKLVQSKMNVGNYTESIKKAFEGTGVFGEKIGEASELVEAFSTAEGVAMAGATLLVKALYDNVTATEEWRQKIEAAKEELEAWAHTVLVAGVDSFKYADAAKEASLALRELEIEEINSIVTRQKLRTEAAKSREAAMAENHTTAERIQLLGEFIDKTKESYQVEIEEAQKKAQAIATRNAQMKGSGAELTPEQLKEQYDAKAKWLQLQDDLAREITRTEKRRTDMIQKDMEDRAKLRQDANKNSLESIDTFSEDEFEAIQKRLEKKKKLDNDAMLTEIENAKKKQAELGAIDADGKDHTEEFAREIRAIRLKYHEKEIEDDRAAAKETQDLNDKIHAEYVAWQKSMSDKNAKQAEADFKLSEAERSLEEQRAITAIQLSKKTEEEKYQAILAIKIKYLQDEKKLYEDDKVKQLELEKQIQALIAEGAVHSENEADKHRKETLKKEKELQDNLADGLKEGLEQRAKIQEQYDQKNIDYHNRMIEVQSKLAAEGKANVLANEMAAADKAEEKKIQDQKRAAKMQENLALAKTFSDVLNGEMEKDHNFFKAFGKAIAAVGASEAVFAKLFAGSFAEGTEDTGTLSGGGVDGKGGRVAIIHDNERILTKDQNAMLAGMTNDEVAEKAAAFDTIYRPQFNAFNTTGRMGDTARHDAELARVLSTKIDALQQAIESKPVSTVSLNGLGEWTETISNGVSRTIIRHKTQASRPSLRHNG